MKKKNNIIDCNINFDLKDTCNIIKSMDTSISKNALNDSVYTSSFSLNYERQEELNMLEKFYLIIGFLENKDLENMIPNIDDNFSYDIYITNRSNIITCDYKKNKFDKKEMSIQVPMKIYKDFETFIDDKNSLFYDQKVLDKVYKNYSISNNKFIKNFITQYLNELNRINNNEIYNYDVYIELNNIKKDNKSIIIPISFNNYYNSFEIILNITKKTIKADFAYIPTRSSLSSINGVYSSLMALKNHDMIIKKLKCMKEDRKEAEDLIDKEVSNQDKLNVAKKIISSIVSQYDDDYDLINKYMIYIYNTCYMKFRKK